MLVLSLVCRCVALCVWLCTPVVASADDLPHGDVTYLSDDEDDDDHHGGFFDPMVRLSSSDGQTAGSSASRPPSFDPLVAP